MKSRDRLRAWATFGSRDIGNPWVTVTGGCGDTGSVLHLKVPTGRIRITTTIAKGGCCTKDIGTARTTTTATGGIGGEGIRNMMIMVMNITTRDSRQVGTKIVKRGARQAWITLLDGADV